MLCRYNFAIGTIVAISWLDLELLILVKLLQWVDKSV